MSYCIFRRSKFVALEGQNYLNEERCVDVYQNTTLDTPKGLEWSGMYSIMV